GATLSLLARGVDGLQRTAEEAGGAFVHGVDIRDAHQVDTAFAAAAEANGPIHALVANSGIGGPNDPGPGDRFEDLVATNLVGTYRCIRAAARALASGPERRDVVVISSILARIAVPGYTGYSASKAGLLGLVRALAAELAPRQVNAICPGWVDTEMAWSGLAQIPSGWDEARREVPTGRMTQPDEIAATVLWLLTDARNLTGQAIDHNGGAWMG